MQDAYGAMGDAKKAFEIMLPNVSLIVFNLIVSGNSSSELFGRRSRFLHDLGLQRTSSMHNA